MTIYVAAVLDTWGVGMAPLGEREFTYQTGTVEWTNASTTATTARPHKRSLGAIAEILQVETVGFRPNGGLHHHPYRAKMGPTAIIQQVQQNSRHQRP